MEKCCSRYYKTLFQILLNIHVPSEKLPLQLRGKMIKLLWKFRILELVCTKKNRKTVFRFDKYGDRTK